MFRWMDDGCNPAFQVIALDPGKLCVNDVARGTALQENNLSVDSGHAFAFGRHGADLDIFKNISLSQLDFI